MTWLHEPPLKAIRRRELIDPDDGRLGRRTDSGELIRVAPGSYVPRAAWDALTPLEQHAQRVWEASVRLAPGAVISFAAAAALWQMDVLGPWPAKVEVSVPESSGGRTTGLIQRRTQRRPTRDVRRWGHHLLTSPARTAVDMAASRPFVEGVAVTDQALWSRRPNGALADRADLDRALAEFTGRGAVRARRVVEFSSTGAANPRESQSRVLIEALGFPTPIVQHRFVLRSGRVVYPDFWWPLHRIAGELDGLVKYREPWILAGRTPAQALADEKDRGDELRREVAAVARWRVPMLDQPRLLWDILTAAGLPSSRPRPAR